MMCLSFAAANPLPAFITDSASPPVVSPVVFGVAGMAALAAAIWPRVSPLATAFVIAAAIGRAAALVVFGLPDADWSYSLSAAFVWVTVAEAAALIELRRSAWN